MAVSNLFQIRRILRGWAALLVVCGIVFPPPAHAARTIGITDVRAWSAPDSTRIVLDLTGAPAYRVWKSDNPAQVVIEIKGARPETRNRVWNPSDPRIRSVVLEETPKGTRIVIGLARMSPVRHFSLPPYENQKPDRIVLDIIQALSDQGQPDQGQPEAAAPEAPPPSAPTAPSPAAGSRPFLVLVDAGHGGEDPGAIGRYYRTREKTIALQIARYLKREIDATPGMQARLTRDGDYFISLGRRVDIANRMDADLFISIHADSSSDRRTRGTHIYNLAPRSSQDRQAILLARTENASDLVGGAQAVSRLPVIFNANGTPNRIFESRLFAHLALRQLGDVNRGVRQGRRAEAGFWVLKGQRPSILVETGFLSNREDERALRSDDFQRQLAKDLADAVRDYYSARVLRPAPATHVVARGENLGRIARRYGVDVQEIIAQNHITNASVIHEGTRLAIPQHRAELWSQAATRSSEAQAATPLEAHADAPQPTAPAAEAPPQRMVMMAVADPVPDSPAKGTRTHTVAAGQNLIWIARQYNVRFDDLIQANQVSEYAKLLVGQRLEIPPPRDEDDVHVVARGETLSTLAVRYGIKLADLARANGMTIKTRIRRGQSLVVPGGKGRFAQIYQVHPGDTLGDLAVRFSVPLGDLASANGISTEKRLLTGQRLMVPEQPPRIHVVQTGESLSRIAQMYHVAADRLLSRNALGDADLIQVGARLEIPN